MLPLAQETDLTIKLRSKIGSGSYGTVYQCTVHPSLEDREITMATKIIPCQEDGIGCLFECSLMATPLSTHLLNAQAIRATNDSVYLLSSLAPSNLYQACRDPQRSIDLQTLATWIEQLLKALVVLHQADVIHGDVKPHNILIDSSNRIQLTDFTLATRSGWNHDYKVCTCNYRPPEVWCEAAWNAGVDVWAFGCTVYFMLTKTLLFPMVDGRSLTDHLTDVASFLTDLHQDDPDTDVHPAYRRFAQAWTNLTAGSSQFDRLREVLISSLTPDPRYRPTSADLYMFLTQTPLAPRISPPPPSEHHVVRTFVKNDLPYSEVNGVITIVDHLVTRCQGRDPALPDRTLLNVSIYMAVKIVHRFVPVRILVRLRSPHLRRLERLVCRLCNFYVVPLDLPPAEQKDESDVRTW